MITATAILRGTITATAVIFATQVGSCAAATAVLKNTDNTTLSTTSIASGATQNITAPDATVTVNSAAFDTVASGGTLNVPVKNTAGTIVGSIVGGEVIAPDGTYVVQNSLGQTQSSGSIRSGAVNFGIPAADANVTVNSAAYDTVPSDATLNVQVKNTLGSFVGSLVAGLWQIANSQVVIKNSLATIIATQAVSAEASADYTLADTTYVFQINGVNQNSVTVASMIDYTFNINFVP